MKAPSKKNRHLISQMLATLISFGLFTYFGFHLLRGDMGYFALRGLDQKLVETQEKYDHLVVERKALENRVRLMRPGSMDKDLLDERIRLVLGYANPNDRVILEK